MKRPPATRVITRYDNRKLYDSAARRYVTLEDLAALLKTGVEIQVLDQRSGDDLTTLVLAQIVLERVKQRTADVPRQVLARLIRLDTPRRPAPAAVPGPDVATRAREEAERIAGGLIARGRLTLEEALALRQDIAQSVQAVASDVQQGLEQRLQRLLHWGEAAARPSFEALKERLLAFETSLGEEPNPTPRPGRRRGGRKHS